MSQPVDRGQQDLNDSIAHAIRRVSVEHKLTKAEIVGVLEVMKLQVLGFKFKEVNENE